MYCSKCELEIKGDDQKECPICGSALIESTSEDDTQQEESVEDNAELMEIMEDIDEKLKKNLEDSATEEEFKIEDLELGDEEPAETDFSLEMEDQNENVPTETEFSLDLEDLKTDGEVEISEETSFDLSDEKDVAPEESPIVELEEFLTNAQDDEKEVNGIIEQIEDEGVVTEPELEGLDASGIESEGIQNGDVLPDDIIDEVPAEEEVFDLERELAIEEDDEAMAELLTEEAEEEMEVPVEKSGAEESEEIPAEEPVSEEQISTKAILDRALDELDTVGKEGKPHKKTSLAKSMAVIVVLLIAVIGGGYYLMYTSELLPLSNPEDKVIKRDNAVLNKLLKKDDTKPAVVEKKVQTTGRRIAQKKTSVEKKEPAVTARKTDWPKEEVPFEKPVLKNKAAPEKMAVPTQEPSAVKKTAVAKEKAVPLQEPLDVKKKAVPKQEPAAAREKAVAVKKPLAKEQPPASQKGLVLKGSIYSVHAGSYRNKKAAQNEVEKFKTKGFDAYIEDTNLGKKSGPIWYRVKIGYYKSNKDAENIQKDLHRKFKKVETRILMTKYK